MSETQIKNQILDYLKYKGIFCWLTNTQGNYNKFTGTYFKNPRLLRGVADIIGLLPDGRFFAIEVKDGRGKQTEYQIEFERQIKRNNGTYILVRSLDEIIDNEIINQYE